jgi:hypothetical protein
VPRRCRPRRVAGPVTLGLALAAPVALFALAPTPGQAQTADPQFNAGLLQPSLEGNPGNPPSFVPPGNSAAPPGQAPPAGQFTALSRIGATPDYGSPAGFGAGDTGFDSSNARKRKRLAQAPGQGSAIAPAPETTFEPVPGLPPQVSAPALLPPPPPPEVHPAKAASRPGAILPPPPDQLPLSNPPPEVHPLSAANRPGATLPIPPPEDFQGSASTPPPGTPPPNTLPLGTVPHGTLPIAAGDPYAALGIRAGSFLILPAIELSGGYSTNPTHGSPTGPPSFSYVVAPELHVRSQWPSSSLTADIAGSFTDYQRAFIPSLNVPFLNAKTDGIYDVSRTTQLLAELRTIVSTDNPGSPNIQAGLAKLPIDTTVGATLGGVQQFARFAVTLKGTFDRSMYSDALLTDGTQGNFDWRAFDQYGGIGRLAYEIDPGMKPYVEVDADERVHDSTFDINGVDRNSTGTAAKLGADIAFTGSLTGEIAVGYMQRDYIAPLPNIGGMTLDGALLWQATPLTSAKFTATSSIGESTLPGVSGEFSRDVNLEVDHAFRTWLVAMAQAGYGHDSYVGLGRDDNRYFVSAGLTYKMNRDVQFKGTVRQDWLTSNVSGAAYSATSFLLTMRLQR